MHQKIAIIYNQPNYSYSVAVGEEKAELSILSVVKAVHRALHNLGYAVVRVPLSPPVEQAKERLARLKTGLVFNLFEGFDEQPESEATVACYLAELGFTYTGCPSDVLALALNKAKIKKALEAAGIVTPKYQVLRPDMLPLFHLDYPCIVKPCGQDASHGMSSDSVVGDIAQLEKLVLRISQQFGGEALVEEFIDGREFNITVWGNGVPSVLPITEIVYSLPPDMPKILTFDAKWERSSIYFQNTKPVCPAKISDELRSSIEHAAMSIFKLLNCSGYLRLDMRVDSRGHPNIFDVNPNPDIDPGTGAARQAKAAGMTYTQFISSIVHLALGVRDDHADHTADDWQRQAGYHAYIAANA